MDALGHPRGWLRLGGACSAVELLTVPAPSSSTHIPPHLSLKNTLQAKLSLSISFWRL